MDFNQAVQNVVSGLSAEGADNDFCGTPSAFTQNEQAQVALADACVKLRQDIRRSIRVENDKGVTIFIAKMASYAAKQGWNKADKLTQGFNTIRVTLKDAVLEAPDLLLDSKAGIQAILRKHEQSAQQGIAKLRQAQMNDNKSPPPVLYDVGDYVLVELLAPIHLTRESISIGGSCCIGTSYNLEALTQNGVGEEEGAIEYLTYAIKIRSGESRIFSLRDKAGKSYAAIEYDVQQKAITQIEGNPKEIQSDTPFFGALCAALHRLQSDVPAYRYVRGLPDVPLESILTRGGEILPYMADVDLSDVLKGQVRLFEDMPIERVHQLCSRSNFTLDITQCSNQWLEANLPEYVYCNLHTDSREHFEINTVKSIENLTADNVISITMNALQKCGGILAHGAKTIEIDNLKAAYSIWVPKVRAVEMSSLQTARFIIAHDAETVVMDSLQSLGALYADKAIDVQFPEEAKIHTLHTREWDKQNSSASSPKGLRSMWGRVMNTDSKSLPHLQSDPAPQSFFGLLGRLGLW